MPEDISQVKQALDKAEEVLVLLPQNPGPDSIASALALHLALKQAGKHSNIACGTPLDFDDYPLRQASEIGQKIGNKNLVVSLKIDQRDSVDKVSYNLDENNKVFNLIITPKKGAAPLDSNAVTYSMSGVRADLIITIGANSFDELGSLYTAEPNIFNDVPTVAVNRLEPSRFAAHHLNNPQASSIAEYMVAIFSSLELSFNSDIATNLMAAIDVVTDKLQLMNATASTFESVAKLMRAGAVRVMLQPELSLKKDRQVEITPAVETEKADNLIVKTSEELASPEEVPEDWLSPKIYQAPKDENK